MISVHCPSCQRVVAVPDTFVGKRVRCGNCGEAFVLPDAGVGPPPPPPTQVPQALPVVTAAAPSPRRQKRAGTSKWLFVGCGAVIGVIVLLIVLVAFVLPFLERARQAGRVVGKHMTLAECQVVIRPAIRAEMNRIIEAGPEESVGYEKPDKYDIQEIEWSDPKTGPYGANHVQAKLNSSDIVTMVRVRYKIILKERPQAQGVGRLNVGWEQVRRFYIKDGTVRLIE
jgi:hypothetical protein